MVRFKRECHLDKLYVFILQMFSCYNKCNTCMIRDIIDLNQLHMYMKRVTNVHFDIYVYSIPLVDLYFVQKKSLRVSETLFFSNMYKVEQMPRAIRFEKKTGHGSLRLLSFYAVLYAFFGSFCMIYTLSCIFM